MGSIPCVGLRGGSTEILEWGFLFESHMGKPQILDLGVSVGMNKERGGGYEG
jgi:hypothetical protein